MSAGPRAHCRSGSRISSTAVVELPLPPSRNPNTGPWEKGAEGLEVKGKGSRQTHVTAVKRVSESVVQAVVLR